MGEWLSPLLGAVAVLGAAWVAVAGRRRIDDALSDLHRAQRDGQDIDNLAGLRVQVREAWDQAVLAQERASALATALNDERQARRDDNAGWEAKCREYEQRLSELETLVREHRIVYPDHNEGSAS